MIRSAVIFFCLFVIALPAHAADSAKQQRVRLGVAIPYGLNSFEPLAVVEPITTAIFANAAHRLIRYGGDGSIMLDIASGYEQKDEGLRWEVALPRDVYFSDGSPLLGSSVVRLYEFYRSRAKQFAADLDHLPHGVTSALLEQLQSIASVESVLSRESAQHPIEKEVIVFTLNKADPIFWHVLTLPLLDMRVVDAFGTRAFDGTNIALLGPYAVGGVKADGGITLRKAAHYFRPGFPNTEQLEFRQFSDAAQALSALRVGAVDIIVAPTANMLAHVEKDPTLQTIDSPLNGLSYRGAPWKLLRDYWSERENPRDKGILSKVVVRKSLYLDDAARKRFDLTSVYLE